MRQAITIILLTFLAYLPSLRAGFIWDDDSHLLYTPEQTSLRGLLNVWNPRLGFMAQYYPVTSSSFWIEHQLWGSWAPGYHTVNVAVHAAAAVMLWRLLLLLRVPGAFWVAMLFAVHPVQVESVAWVSERKNTLSGLFYFTAALVFVRSMWRDDDKPRSWAGYALATLLFAVSILSKSVTCTLPAALLLVRWWKQGRLTRRGALELLPWFAIGIAGALNTASIEHGTLGATGPEWNVSRAQRLILAGREVIFYAGKLLVPWPLSFDYEKWVIDPAQLWQWMFPAAVVVSLAVLAILVIRRAVGRGSMAAILFFLGTLLPVLGFFNFYLMRYAYVADHFQYLPCIGILALLVAIGRRAIGRDWARRALGWTLVFAFTAVSFVRSTAYLDAETLWRDTIEKSPNAWMPYANLGQLLAEQNRYDEAAGALAKSLELNPDQAEAHLILGDLLAKVGDESRAATEYQAAIERRPRNFRAHYSLAKLLAARSDLPAAQREFEQTVELEPRFIDGRAALASLLYKLSQGRDRVLLDQAIDQMGRAIDLSPDDATLHNNLAVYLEARGDLREALKEYETAVRLIPKYQPPAQAAVRVREKLR